MDRKPGVEASAKDFWGFRLPLFAKRIPSKSEKVDGNRWESRLSSGAEFEAAPLDLWASISVPLFDDPDLNPMVHPQNRTCGLKSVLGSKSWKV